MHLLNLILIHGIINVSMCLRCEQFHAIITIIIIISIVIMFIIKHVDKQQLKNTQRITAKTDKRPLR